MSDRPKLVAGRDTEVIGSREYQIQLLIRMVDLIARLQDTYACKGGIDEISRMQANIVINSIDTCINIIREDREDISQKDCIDVLANCKRIIRKNGSRSRALADKLKVAREATSELKECIEMAVDSPL